eukprot:gnl/Dysnectes_brevis/182_a211_10065.p1 GENE.gnl/Dysnectes_brevis/182_a211_10065~~gnl/Dysnectes_brevis/182_a211_10065.p1  ORF type:complete len:143 (+),score=16.74 gnl/Dysnectes_brevis/182_a211_10065:27-455(+)
MVVASDIFETIMLICFGFSWPISILKVLRTKKVAGKSPLFMVLIISGYLCGIGAKVTSTGGWIIALYGFNASLVSVDLALYLHYSKKNSAEEAKDDEKMKNVQLEVTEPAEEEQTPESHEPVVHSPPTDLEEAQAGLFTPTD